MSDQSDIVLDLWNQIGRYGKQLVQLFAALAGLTGLFFAIGFILVNLSLLRLGLFETGILRLGYVVPGAAFAVLFAIVVAGTIAVFYALHRLWGDRRGKPLFVVILGSAIVIIGSIFLGWTIWFWRNMAQQVVVWALFLGLVAAILAFAERFPVVKRWLDGGGETTSPVLRRLNSAPFLLLSTLLLLAFVVTYGYFVYDQIPPVYGGGQPIVVRFFGEDVGSLEEIGIDLEPGHTSLTERVELIAQTEDRFIVRFGDRAIAFDKAFVQGIRSEPPEFFLEEEFFWETHTRQGERFFEDGQLDPALSEFNLVLEDNSKYAPALFGRIRVYEAHRDFSAALTDYRSLIAAEPDNGEHYYGLATTYVLAAQPAGGDGTLDGSFEADAMLSALKSAFVLDPELLERAREDPVFDSLRANKAYSAFDVLVYGTGSNAALRFRGQAVLLQESGNLEEAAAAYFQAIDYARAYKDESDSLGVGEISRLYIDLSRITADQNQAIAQLDEALEIEGLSPEEQAEIYVEKSKRYAETNLHADKELEALRQAVADTNQENPKYLNLLGDLYLKREQWFDALGEYETAERLADDMDDDANRRKALVGQGSAAFGAAANPEISSEAALGLYKTARRSFDAAIKLPPRTASTWYDYARTLAIMGDEDAATSLREAVELDLTFATRAQEDDWEQYFSNVEGAVTSLIESAVKFKEARELRDSGAIEGAIEALQEAVDLDPGVALYWHELGDALSQSGRYAEAVVAYTNAAVQVEGDDPDLFTSLALAELASGDPAAAVESVSIAINMLGDMVPAPTFAILARSYEAAGEFTSAADAYQEAARVDPSNHELPFRAGINLLLAGQVERALTELSPVIETGMLRVQTMGTIALREGPSKDSIVLADLTTGSQFIITGQPSVNEIEGEVWWPIRDEEGQEGFVPSSEVTPSNPG